VTLPGGTALPCRPDHTTARGDEQPCLSVRTPGVPHDLARADDAALVALVGTGSAAAFGVLVERHGAALYRVAVRMLADVHEAEDVVEDCFVRLWQHAAGWQPSGAGLVGWLHRVTINLCFDRKRRFRVISTPDLPDSVDDAPLADRLIEAEQAHAEMSAALAALPAHYHAALVLCYIQGFSNAAAADMLNLNLKAMESLLHRARRHLREILVNRQVALGDLVVVGEIERGHAFSRARPISAG